MSIVAEFARELHEKSPSVKQRTLRPLPWPAAGETVTNIRVLIFDVYGTMLNYWRPQFGQEESKNEALLEAFAKTISFFEMEAYLRDMDEKAQPEKTLRDVYHGLIALKHQLLREKDIMRPEVKIEEVWKAIALMLKRRGYTFLEKKFGTIDEGARCVAYYYNFHVFNRALYPGVAGALEVLKRNNLLLGIVSNAQFYTPIDVTLLLRDQSNGRIEDMGELFEHDLLFYSYEYHTAKPSRALFRKLFDALYEYHVLPAQTLFVGNDLAADIAPAKEAGMKTALFAGDDQCTFVRESDEVVPDITFAQWDELPKRVSFYDK